MKKFRRVMDLVPMMLLWLVLCAFFWGKIFMGLTDTSPENKIVLFIDARVPLATELAVEMEKEKVDRINELARISKTRPLTEDEKSEQKNLREEYLAEVRKALKAK